MFNEVDEIKLTAEVDPTLAALKAKLRAAWMDGDYAAFTGATEILGAWRIERAALRR